MKINIAILFLGAFIFASCKSSTSPSSGTVPPANNTMYITANGSTDTLHASAADTTYDGIKAILVGGVGQAGTSVAGVGAGFFLVNITSTGSYPVGTISVSNPTSYIVMVYSYTDTSGKLVKYSSSTSPTIGAASAGTVTITAISSTSIQATFNGTLTLQSGNGPSTITITNGGVNATFL